MTWRIAAASVIGTSHTKTGLPCQDSVHVRLIETLHGPILISAVSDGAGSAAHSEIGSRAAVTAASCLAENYFGSGGTLSSIERGTALSWLAQVQSVISNLATEAGIPVREFACTLMVAMVGAASSAFLQVGDGAMVVREPGDEGWSYVFWPQHGEYVNSTNFVTSSDASTVMEFAVTHRNIESFSCFSDGIESLVPHYATKAVHDPFFNAMIAPVRDSSANGMDEKLSEGLVAYLSSDRVISPPLHQLDALFPKFCKVMSAIEAGACLAPRRPSQVPSFARSNNGR
jgi:hypothetical protein